MKKLKLVGFGHSHVVAVLKAARNLAPDGGVDAQVIDLRDMRFHELTSTPLDAPVNDEIRSLTADADLVFLCVKGSEHNAWGLIEHPTPFDVLLGGGQSAPRAGSVLVPTSVMRQVVAERMQFTREIIEHFQRVVKRKLVRCQPPPPVPSEDYLRAHAGAFQEKIDRYGVAPRELGLKLWRIQADLMRKEAAELGVELLPCPPAGIDANGYMAERMWNQDPTHANEHYGALVIEQLVEHARRLQAGAAAQN